MEILHWLRLELVNLKKQIGLTNEKIVIGQVGRFSEMKNQEFTLKLAQKLDHILYS